MLNLIVKDILIQKKTLLFSVLYSIFIMFAFNTSDLSKSVYIMGSVAIGYMFILTSLTHDDKNSSNILLMSLPIKKTHIILSKYLSVFVFAVIAVFCTGLIGAVLKWVGLPAPIRFINALDIYGTFISLVFLSSFYFPFYYKFGGIYVRIVNIVFFMAVFFSSSFLMRYWALYQQGNSKTYMAMIVAKFSDWTMGMLILGMMLLLMFFSLLISLNVFLKKEF